ncbi:MAG: type I DNA topoisomerase [Chloroflexota bacterium]|nr:type I DNA topoisomerase [Chloroflexota bacterium]
MNETTGRVLVIVESPAKAKTIGKYLGTKYVVRASMGHVRDLPAKELGVEVENGSFTPKYELVKGRYKTVNEIRTLARESSQVLLATDPDREGEAIAWHIVAAAGLGRGGQSVRRVEFHEITQNAIKAAIANPRAIDMNLVNAQQARRVLDRLVGYKLSPFLCRKIQRHLSAGRVQSVALRVVVEREREVEQFVPREFWTVEADLAKHPFSKKKSDIFRATLHSKAGKKLEFDQGDDAKAVVTALEGANWSVAKVTKRQGKRHPSPPFTTSTIQQEASRKLRFSAKNTMQIAQQLYEGVSLGAEGSTGLITYMRTDSTQVAHEAQTAAREVIEKLFGADYLPERPPLYAKKAKGAQEAHEAIRPTKPEREPEAIKAYLTNDQYLLYRLIWRRFVASQMAPAIIEQTMVDIYARPKEAAPSVDPYFFRATGERVVFPGFMAVYRESRGDSEGEEEVEDGKGLPKLEAGDLLELLKLLAEQHFTQPPPRYGEASLVKALEELGVGRPSTYATILSTIQERGYVVKVLDNKERKFRPTALGRTVNDLLVARFPEVLDVQFTAHMESELDEVAEGKRAWTPLIAAFYAPLMERLAVADREVAKIVVPEEEIIGQSSGETRSNGWKDRTGTGKGSSRKPATATRTRRTRTIETTEEEAPKPRRTRTNTTKAETTGENSSTTRRTRTITSTPKTASPATETPPSATSPTTPTCPLCQKPMVKRKGPYGEFYGCSGYPTCKGIRKVML